MIIYLRPFLGSCRKTGMFKYYQNDPPSQLYRVLRSNPHWGAKKGEIFGNISMANSIIPYTNLLNLHVLLGVDQFQNWRLRGYWIIHQTDFSLGRPWSSFKPNFKRLPLEPFMKACCVTFDWPIGKSNNWAKKHQWSRWALQAMHTFELNWEMPIYPLLLPP